MRYLLTACVVACLALGAGMAHAATPGQVPDSTLAAMGLGGLQPISDAQGTDIRGTGFASVSGFTYVKEGYTTVASRTMPRQSGEPRWPSAARFCSTG